MERLAIRVARVNSFSDYKAKVTSGASVTDLIKFIKEEAPALNLNFTQYQRAYWEWLERREAPSLDDLMK